MIHSVCSSRTIRWIARYGGIISALDITEEQFQPASLDVRLDLGKPVSRKEWAGGDYIPLDCSGGELVLEPGYEYCLGVMELFEVPYHVGVRPRSSFSRIGGMLAGPWWDGLRVFTRTVPIKVRTGDRLAQRYLHNLCNRKECPKIDLEFDLAAKPPLAMKTGAGTIDFRAKGVYAKEDYFEETSDSKSDTQLLVSTNEVEIPPDCCGFVESHHHVECQGLFDPGYRGCAMLSVMINRNPFTAHRSMAELIEEGIAWIRLLPLDEASEQYDSTYQGGRVLSKHFRESE